MSPRHPAHYWRTSLGLTSHPEGGAFAETYRSSITLNKEILPPSFAGDRHASTGIYFLLEHGDFSAFHRIAGDEMWHFYDGESLVIYDISPKGKLTVHKLGLDIEKGEKPQLVIPGGHWFASRCEVENGYCLVGCTVSPGFDFADFQLATPDLAEKYPAHTELIKQLTR